MKQQRQWQCSCGRLGQPRSERGYWQRQQQVNTLAIASVTN
ncbi:hypothetical protein [Acidithiobacillus sp. AMEEHan]|nr:hypothetical protein [Acidithiobacillus sp. AMEEHan]